MRRRKLRETKDQIDADVADTGLLKNRICLACSLRIMAAIHELQDRIVKRLYSHADPVHTQLQKSLHIGMSFLYNILRVHLDSEFIERASMPHRTQSLQKSLESRKRQHRRGATSNI